MSLAYCRVWALLIFDFPLSPALGGLCCSQINYFAFMIPIRGWGEGNQMAEGKSVYHPQVEETPDVLHI